MTVLGMIACSPTPDRATTVVVTDTLRVTLVESGDVDAIRATDVRAPLEWRADLQIIDLVEEGTIVEPGDFLVQLDPGFLEEERAQTAAQLESDEIALGALLARHEVARHQLLNQRRSAEFAEQLAELQLEQRRFEAEASREEAKLALASARVTRSEVETKLTARAVVDSLERVEIELAIAKGRTLLAGIDAKAAALRLTAPGPGLCIFTEWEDDGLIRKARVGEKVYPGFPIVTLPDLSAMQVRFGVNEVDRHLIRAGQAVMVTLEAFPERSFPGRIETVARLASTKRSFETVKEFRVEARIEGTAPYLKPGMSAVVEVLLEEDEVTVVPTDAVFEVEGRAAAFPTRMWPEPVFIELGRRTPLACEVVRGVSPGTELALVPPDDVDARVLGARRFLTEWMP